jgi:hypothetical protein
VRLHRRDCSLPCASPATSSFHAWTPQAWAVSRRRTKLERGPSSAAWVSYAHDCLVSDLWPSRFSRRGERPGGSAAVNWIVTRFRPRVRSLTEPRDQDPLLDLRLSFSLIPSRVLSGCPAGAPLPLRRPKCNSHGEARTDVHAPHATWNRTPVRASSSNGRFCTEKESKYT